MSSLLSLHVPDIGDAKNIELVAWYVSEGDTVNEGQELCELVTDKAAFPLEAPHNGIIAEIVKTKGDLVSVGEVLVHLKKT